MGVGGWRCCPFGKREVDELELEGGTAAEGKLGLWLTVGEAVDAVRRCITQSRTKGTSTAREGKVCSVAGGGPEAGISGQALAGAFIPQRRHHLHQQAK